MPYASAQLEPQLSYGGVSPPEGDITNLFTFSVTFTDVTNTPPSSVNVNIDGVSYPMDADDDLDLNFSDGKIYTYSTRLNLGTHTYIFSATSGNLTIYYPPNGLPLSGPTVTDAGLQDYAQCCTGFTIALIATVIIFVAVAVLIGIYLFKKKKTSANFQNANPSSFPNTPSNPSYPYPTQYNQNINQNLNPQYYAQNPNPQVTQQPQIHTQPQTQTQSSTSASPPSTTQISTTQIQTQPTTTLTQTSTSQPQISSKPAPTTQESTAQESKPKIDAKPITSSAKRETSKKKTECFMCRGDIWPGDMVVSCRCGKDFHESCADAVGECPACGKKV